MILKHDEFNIDYKNISFKKSRQCSNDFTFIPLQYNNQDILIQTPHCFIPFGLNKFSNISSKQYLDLSFQQKNKSFIYIFENIYKIIKKKYKDKYQVENFLKSSQYSQWMRFKVDEDCLFFDQNKKIIKSFPSKIFGIFIIQLSGLWIMNQKMWFNWNILQAKLNIPIKLKDYAFIDDEVKEVKFIPPPPPPCLRHRAAGRERPASTPVPWGSPGRCALG